MNRWKASSLARGDDDRVEELVQRRHALQPTVERDRTPRTSPTRDHTTDERIEGDAVELPEIDGLEAEVRERRPDSALRYEELHQLVRRVDATKDATELVLQREEAQAPEVRDREDEDAPVGKQRPHVPERTLEVADVPKHLHADDRLEP